MFRTENGELAPRVNQSLVKILLTVECVQSEVIQALLGKLRELCDKERDTNSCVKFNLVLTQFKDFGNFGAANLLFDEIFKLLPNCSNTHRDDLVASFAFLLEVHRQSEAVEKLLEIFEDPNQLFTRQNIDTFENLRLDAETLDLLRRKMLDYLRASAPKEVGRCFIYFSVYFKISIRILTVKISNPNSFEDSKFDTTSLSSKIIFGSFFQSL